MNFNEESILGKTGTCSHAGTRFGWFASYANTDIGRIVTVVFLQGGRPTFGPKAAEIAGRMYRNLYDHNFFVAGTAATNFYSGFRESQHDGVAAGVVPRPLKGHRVSTLLASLKRCPDTNLLFTTSS